VSLQAAFTFVNFAMTYDDADIRRTAP